MTQVSDALLQESFQQAEDISCIDEDGNAPQSDSSSLKASMNEFEACCESKADGIPQKLKMRFGRWHTHNEELCVMSCGMILGQVTFYGAEGLNGVQVCFFISLTTFDLCLFIAVLERSIPYSTLPT